MAVVRVMLEEECMALPVLAQGRKDVRQPLVEVAADCARVGRLPLAYAAGAVAVVAEAD